MSNYNKKKIFILLTIVLSFFFLVGFFNFLFSLKHDVDMGKSQDNFVKQTLTISSSLSEELKDESEDNNNITIFNKQVPLGMSGIDPLIEKLGLLGIDSDMTLFYLPYLTNVVTPVCNVLKAESTEESVEMLHQIAEYMPTAGLEIQPCALPLDSINGVSEMEKVMSNRRFLKVLKELSAMPKSQASSLINKEINSTLPLYLTMLDETIEGFKKTGEINIGTQLFNNPDKSPCFMGLRLKLLALVFTAGNLGLEQSHSVIQEVAKTAISQRKRWYYSRDFSKIDRASILLNFGIYNRQILTVGLFGTSSFSKQEINDILKRSGIQMQDRKLTYFDSSATPYDFYTVRGLIPADFSKGEQTVRFSNSINDKTFDSTLKAAGMAQLLDVKYVRYTKE